MNSAYNFKGQLLIKVTFSVSFEYPLYTGLTVIQTKYIKSVADNLKSYFRNHS